MSWAWNAAGGLIPSPIMNLLAGALAVLLIVAFASLYGYIVWLTWRNTARTADFLKASPGYAYVATTLAGLVGAIVAAAFNERLPDDAALKRSPQFVAATEGAPPETPSAAAPAAATAALKNLAVPDQRFGWQSILASVYALTYFVVGIAAIVTWASIDGAPDLLKNLSLIALGLFLAIVRSFFNLQ